MISLEFIQDRLRAMLSDRKADIPAEAVDRIRSLETQLAEANARLIAEGHAQRRLDAELPAMAQAVADAQEHFDRLIVDARADVPAGAQAQIADIEKRLAAQRVETEALRKERDEAVKTSGDWEFLWTAAKRWRTDGYTPRLQSVVDTLLRKEVSKR